MKFLALLLTLILPIQVFAETKPYISFGAGLSVFQSIEESIEGIDVDINLSNAAKVGGAIGVELGKNRLEIEYSGRLGGFSSVEALGAKVSLDGDVTADALMFNGYHNFGDFGFLSPYLGVGIGKVWEDYEIDRVAGVDISGYGINAEEDGFAFQVMAGTTTKLTEHLSSDLEYRYFDGVEIKAHEFGVNLRYSF